MNEIYKQQVALLLKIIPTLSGIDCFAVHGGTAINLYELDFEAGSSLSKYTDYQEFLKFPSVQWKQLNISKLKSDNPAKHKQGVEKLAQHFGL